MPPLQAAEEADLGAFAELLDSERLAPNLHRAYGELGGTAQYPPAGVDHLFAELVDLHGGVPDCRA
ncbi:hypothetical protein [Streptomyces spinosirectus]